MKWRRAISITAALSAVASGAIGWTMYREAQATSPLLPAFVEPGGGPRVPDTSAFGFSLGRSKLADVSELLRARGLDCEDTSLRAMMANKRAVALAAEEGQPDVITRASWVDHPSPAERNPQVRMTCDELPSLLPIGVGPDQAQLDLTDAYSRRMLLVFDSAELPLRHASVQRTYRDPEPATRDFRSTLAALEGRYGASTQRSGTFDDATASATKLQPVVRAWTYSDAEIKLTITNFGRRTVVTQITEVPWPVHSDAPAR